MFFGQKVVADIDQRTAAQHVSLEVGGVSMWRGQPVCGRSACGEGGGWGGEGGVHDDDAYMTP